MAGSSVVGCSYLAVVFVQAGGRPTPSGLALLVVALLASYSLPRFGDRLERHRVAQALRGAVDLRVPPGGYRLEVPTGTAIAADVTADASAPGAIELTRSAVRWGASLRSPSAEGGPIRLCGRRWTRS